MLSRRRLLLLMSVLPFATLRAKGNILGNQSPQGVYLSAAKDTFGNHHAIAFSEKGNIVFSHPLPSRGHTLTANLAYRQLIAVSRRPETTIDIMTLKGDFIERLKAGTQRHFYGHIACQTSGTLYTTENNMNTGDGIIGVWEFCSEGYKKTKEYLSYGIGPHEILLSNDDRYIIVANGGVKTHPQSGRKKLNLRSMKPLLVIINASTGKLVHQLVLPEEQHLNSIRHITQSSSNIIYIALQNQSKSLENEVLLMQLDLETQHSSVFFIPHKIQSVLKGYIGSIALDRSEKFMMASAPKGDRLLLFYSSGQFIDAIRINDVCGIAKSHLAGHFIATSGDGNTYTITVNERMPHTNVSVNIVKLKYHHSIQWDNHLTYVSYNL